MPVGFTQQFDAMAFYSNSTQGDVSSSVQWSVAPASAGAINTLPIGASQQLSLTGLFSDATTQNLTTLETWQSQNPAIATVNAQGVATSISSGNVTFTGSFGGQTATTPPLTVTNATLLHASLTAATADVTKGFSTPLSLTGHFPTAPRKP